MDTLGLVSFSSHLFSKLTGYKSLSRQSLIKYDRKFASDFLGKIIKANLNIYTIKIKNDSQ